ncbi:hypothetical protein E2542_SST17870 [Spatholobus suberectus]|nr:hypothetical protein E2542_SST17870 [Spatholobus suberectus]
MLGVSFDVDVVDGNEEGAKLKAPPKAKSKSWKVRVARLPSSQPFVPFHFYHSSKWTATWPTTLGFLSALKPLSYEHSI